MFDVTQFEILSMQPVYSEDPFWKGTFRVRLPDESGGDYCQNVELSVIVPLQRGAPAEDILQSLFVKAQVTLSRAAAILEGASAVALAEKSEQDSRQAIG